MTERSFDDYLQAANAPLDDPSGNVQVGRGRPRSEVYHFPLPVCSQKVRTCLAEKQAAYIGHDINIQPGNDHPDHIRLRMPGGRGRRLVRGYTGRSSMATEGFDPAVVPTLVGIEEQRVYVDTVKTCAHVDRVCGTGTDLLPDSLLPCIWAEIAIVDGTPHVAKLYGAHPDGDFRPEKRRGGMQGVHDRKTEKPERIRERVAGGHDLTVAPDANIRKESAARSFVTTPDMMRNTVTEIVGILADLEGRLDGNGVLLAGR